VIITEAKKRKQQRVLSSDDNLHMRFKKWFSKFWNCVEN